MIIATNPCKGMLQHAVGAVITVASGVGDQTALVVE
jgi:hypothetical protein